MTEAEEPTSSTSRRRPEIPRLQSVDNPEVSNPFIHRLHFGPWDVIKISLMSVTIAPLRLLVSGLILLMAWPIAALGVWCTSKEEKKEPLRGWKLYYARFLRVVLRAVFFCWGFHWVTVRGKLASTKDAPIVCLAPHSSMFDMLACFLGLDLGSGVSKEENARIPIAGDILQFTQPVLIAREAKESRQAATDEIQKRSHSGGQWPQINIFPEGTCSNRSCLISFQLGAFIPAVPVQPVCISYPNRMDTMTWTWDGPAAWKLFWLTLSQIHNRMEVEFLPVYTPSAAEKKDPQLFAHNVRERMAECLGLPVTDHTYNDCRLMMRAGSLNMPLATGLVEFHKLHDKLGLRYDDIRALLKKFQVMDCSGRGMVTMEEFAKYLRLPVSPALEEVFTLYDRNQSGTINFREYVIGLTLLANPANSEDTLLLAFQLFDKDQKGYITQSELQMILCSAFTMSEEEAGSLFNYADTDHDGKITYEEFKAYAEEKPEYAKLFITYQEIKSSSLKSEPLVGGSTQGIVINVSPATLVNRRLSPKEEEGEKEEGGEGEEEEEDGVDFASEDKFKSQ